MIEMVEYEAGGLTIQTWPLDEGNRPATAHASITRAQGKAALIQAGLWSGVEAFVAAIPDETERALANVALHDTLTWKRSSPFLAAAAQALGITDEQLDALFAMADSVEL